MTSFWAHQIDKALKMKLRRARIIAKKGGDRIEHPDEFREAQQDKFTMLNKRITEKFEKFVKAEQDRRQRIYGA